MRSCLRGPVPGRLWLLWIGGVLLACAACTRSPARKPDAPSIALFVYDTLRFDAVSFHGNHSGTTPFFDSLAIEGLVYARAYTSSPWTLPSHASMFTGLAAWQHGVGIDRLIAGPELSTVAELLSAAGYETVAISENPFVDAYFGLTQGFSIAHNRNEDHAGGVPEFDAITLTREWLAKRRAERPFFLFVNVMDAHGPYPLRDGSVLRSGTHDPEHLTALGKSLDRICSRIPPAEDLRLIRQLYLDGVAAADEKVRAIFDLVRDAPRPGPLITVLTSDHGEHLGERRLLEHQFSVHHVLLHVPLVVHGLPNCGASRIETPVVLDALAASIVRWAGVSGDDGMAGPLPTATAAAAVSFRADYSDSLAVVPADLPGWLRDGLELSRQRRSACGDEDKVFGRMTAFVRWPYKLNWFERYAPELFDVVRDPDESHDLGATQPELLARMRFEFEHSFPAVERPRSGAPAGTVPPALQERLRQLGYIED